MIDIWQFNNSDEIRKKVRKRTKKAKRSIREEGGDASKIDPKIEEIILEDRIGKNISTKSGNKNTLSN